MPGCRRQPRGLLAPQLGSLGSDDRSGGSASLDDRSDQRSLDDDLESGGSQGSVDSNDDGGSIGEDSFEGSKLGSFVICHLLDANKSRQDC